MITQAYQTFTEFNQTGAAALFIYPAHLLPIFIPLLLFTLFIIVLSATYFSEKRITGKGNFLASFAVASYLTSVIAFLMTLVEGLINLTTLVTVVVISIVATILLLIPRN